MRMAIVAQPSIMQIPPAGATLLAFLSSFKPAHKTIKRETHSGSIDER